MIVVRAPFRVSFLGGGSDLPFFYKKYGGAVLSSAINRHMFITGREMFDGTRSLLKYSKTEYIERTEDIEHPIFREVFRQFDLKGIDFGVSSDIPAGTGLGSSSTFTVALITLANSMTHSNLTIPEIAELACKIEIDVLGENIGKQDQYASAFGGLNLFKFLKSGAVEAHPFPLKHSDMTWFKNSLFLVKIPGEARSAGNILSQVQAHIENNSQAQHATMALADLAVQGFEELRRFGVRALPNLLNEAWRLKKITTPSSILSSANKILEKGLESGASAGKLLGAGGGGFVLFILDPVYLSNFLTAMKDYKILSIVPDSNGAKIIYEEDDKS